ncbi:MAG: YgjP-like metallopeptidase domain-containing protein [Lachnospira pectinoschiza]
MENMDIQIIKSRRRTVSIEVHTDGSVILRAPNRMTKKELDIFIDKHMSWIESKQQLMKERKEEKIPTNAKAFDMLTPKERAVIRGTFIRKVEYYSKIMNVTVGRVTIRNQKTR